MADDDQGRLIRTAVLIDAGTLGGTGISVSELALGIMMLGAMGNTDPR